MATTTNYGWTTPDDTALVKDGASAIRTLGSSVDTTTKNLNPETTLGDLSFRSSTSNVNTRIGIGSSGQHLTVVAGVPAWATASDQTPLTTKGDLFTFSTLDARLGVGANNTVLTADSAEATGLKWAAAGGGGKVLQVLNFSLDSAATTTSATPSSTGLTLSITPSAVSSKILIFASINGLITTSNNSRYYLYKGASLLKNITSVVVVLKNGSITYLDSPATTSSTTYAIYFSTSGGTAYINDYSVTPGDTTSQITVMEIGA